MYEEDKCSLRTVRLDVELYASAAVDAEGVADDDEVIANLMDNIKDWQPCHEDRYYCQWCGGYWHTWEDAKRHLDAVGGADGRLVIPVVDEAQL